MSKGLKMLLLKKHSFIYTILLTLLIPINVLAIDEAKTDKVLDTSGSAYFTALTEAAKQTPATTAIDAMLKVKPSKLAGRASIDKFSSKFLPQIYAAKAKFEAALTALVEEMEKNPSTSLVKDLNTFADFLPDGNDNFVMAFTTERSPKNAAFFKPFDNLAKRCSKLAKKSASTGVGDKKKLEELETAKAKVEEALSGMQAELVQQKATTEKLDVELKLKEAALKESKTWTGGKSAYAALAENLEANMKAQEASAAKIAELEAALEAAKQTSEVKDVEAATTALQANLDTTTAKQEKLTQQLNALMAEKGQLAGKNAELEKQLAEQKAETAKQIAELEAKIKKNAADKLAQPNAETEAAKTETKLNDTATKELKQGSNQLSETLKQLERLSQQTNTMDSPIILNGYTKNFLEYAAVILTKLKNLVDAQAEIKKILENANPVLSGIKEKSEADIFIPEELKVDMITFTTDRRVIDSKIAKLATTTDIKEAKTLFLDSITIYTETLKNFGESFKAYINANDSAILEKVVTKIDPTAIDKAIANVKTLAPDQSWKRSTFLTVLENLDKSCLYYEANIGHANQEFSNQMGSMITLYWQAVDLVKNVKQSDVEKVVKTTSSRKWSTLGIKTEDLLWQGKFDELSPKLKASIVLIIKGAGSISVASDKAIALLESVDVKKATFNDIVNAVRAKNENAEFVYADDNHDKDGTYTKLSVKTDDKATFVLDKNHPEALAAVNDAIQTKLTAAASAQIPGLVDSLVEKVTPAQTILNAYPLLGVQDAQPIPLEGNFGVPYPEFRHLNDDNQSDAKIQLEIKFANHCFRVARLPRNIYPVNDNVHLIGYNPENDRSIIEAQAELKKSSDVTLWKRLKKLNDDQIVAPRLTELVYIAQTYGWLACAYRIVAAAEAMLGKKETKAFTEAKAKASKILKATEEAIATKFANFASTEGKYVWGIFGTQLAEFDFENKPEQRKAYIDGIDALQPDDAPKFSADAKKAFEAVKALDFEALVQDKQTGEENKKLLANAFKSIKDLNTKDQTLFTSGLSNIVKELAALPDAVMIPYNATNLAKALDSKIKKATTAGWSFGMGWNKALSLDLRARQELKERFIAKGVKKEDETYENFFKIFEKVEEKKDQPAPAPAPEPKPAPAPEPKPEEKKDKDLFASAMKSINGGGKEKGKRATGIDTKDGAQFKRTFTAALKDVAKIDKLTEEQAKEMATALNDKIDTAQASSNYQEPDWKAAGTTADAIKQKLTDAGIKDLENDYTKLYGIE